jgi:integral membrane protein (TIGR01906 family)
MSLEQFYLQPTMKKGLRTAIQLLIPIILILGSVWIILVTAKSWIPYEYRLSTFPVDSYGFTIEDRINWSAIDLDFLLNDAEIDYFDEFELESGEPMHNDRELRHMEDVKVIVLVTKSVLQWGLVVLVGLIAFAGWSQGYEFALLTIKNGALWTLVIIGVLIIGVIVAFGFVFVGFHRIFFEAGTWTFRYSDTFIRLYPEKFWRDVFFYVGGLTTLQAGVLFGLAKWVLRRKFK